MSARLPARAAHCRRAAWLAVAAALVLPGCGIFGDDEDEADLPAELVKIEATLKIRKAWSQSVGDSSEFLRLALAPASDGATIYAAAHDGRVAAFEAVGGKRRWQVKTGLPIAGGPATDGEILVMGSSDGDVLVLSAEDGSELWRRQVSSEVLAAPAIARTAILVRTVDGRLLALSRDDGAEIWLAQQSVPRLSVRGTGAPVVDGTRVICGFDNGKVAAYELADGTLAWEALLSPPVGRSEVERLSDLNATVRVIGNDVYSAGYQSRTASLALESGQVIWTRDISSYNDIGADFGNLYISDDRSALHALARSTGRELWQHEQLRNRDISGPTPFGGSVVVGDFEGWLHWFDARDGTPQARVRAGSDRISAAPLVVGDQLYVLTDAGKLFAFRDATPAPAE